jgi:hypothetical protein
LKGFLTVHWLPAGALTDVAPAADGTTTAGAAAMVMAARTASTCFILLMSCLLSNDGGKPARRLLRSPTGTRPENRLTVKSVSFVNA